MTSHIVTPIWPLGVILTHRYMFERKMCAFSDSGAKNGVFHLKFQSSLEHFL